MIVITPGAPRVVTLTGPNYWWDQDVWVDDDIWWDSEDPSDIGIGTFNVLNPNSSPIGYYAYSAGVMLVSGEYSTTFANGSGMYKLLPTGTAWPKEHEVSVLKDFIYGLSIGIDRLVDSALDNLNLILPGDTGKYLQDWERFLGLPKCDDIEMTLQQRAASVLAMWNISPYSNEQFFVDIGAVFGFDITVSNGIRGGARDIFNIYIGIENPENPIYFRAGASGAGDRLVEYDFGPIECLINFFKPAHTYIIFEFKYPDATPADPVASMSTVLMSGTYTAN